MENMKRQSGFTLIELVMVIVILGILAAVAIPKFVDLKGDAAQAAVNGIAGTLSSASAINYAAKSANSANGNDVAFCGDVVTSLQGGLPSPYVVASAATAAVTLGQPTTCTVTNGATPAVTATFIAIGI
jgi:MSHA pilin protein MshA